MAEMNRKKREALVISMHENGKTYREIAKELRMSPNTIKAILARAGYDESSSISSRAFEIFQEGKSPLDVAKKLNLEADESIRLHGEYFKLLGCIEFTRVYQEIREDPWPFVDLVKVANKQHMNAEKVAKLLDITNNHLPSIESKYESLKKDVGSLENEKKELA